MRRANQITAIFCLAVGLAVIYGSQRVGYGTLSHPGPGFLSFWCGVFLSALSLLVFVQTTIVHVRGGSDSLRQLWTGMKWEKGLYVVLALIFYTFTFSHLGFLLTTMILLIFLFKAIAPQKWYIALGGALITSLVSFIVFARWLDVQLPQGILEKLLF